MVAFVPDALSGRNRLPIAANVSCTVGIAFPPLYSPSGRLRRAPPPDGRAILTLRDRSAPPPDGRAILTLRDRRAPPPDGRAILTLRDRSAPPPDGRANVA